MATFIQAQCNCPFFLEWGRHWSESEQLRNAIDRLALGEVQADAPIANGEGEWTVPVLTVSKNTWREVKVQYPAETYTPCFCKHVAAAIRKVLAAVGVHGALGWMPDGADIKVTQFIGVRLRQTSAR